MLLADFFSYDDKPALLEQLKKLQPEWEAIPLLCSILTEGKFNDTFGKGTLNVLLDEENLTDGKPTIAAFATFCDRDEIDTDLKPWIGFVFTQKAYRGRHLMGRIIEHYMREAATSYPESEYVYVSTGEIGLYEKYGFSYFTDMTSRWNGKTRVYRQKTLLS